MANRECLIGETECINCGLCRSAYYNNIYDSKQKIDFKNFEELSLEEQLENLIKISVSKEPKH